MSESNSNINFFKKGEEFLKSAQKLIQQKNFNQAREDLIQAIECFQQTQSSLTEGQALFLIGMSYENENRWKDALIYYRQALEKREIAGSNLLLSETHKKIATIYNFLGEREKSQEELQISLDLLENEKSPLLMAKNLVYQGDLYLEDANYTSALFYYNLASEHLEKQPDEHLSLKIEENLGYIYHEIGKYEESNNFLKNSLTHNHKLKNFYAIQEILRIMALNCIELNQNDTAIQLIEDSLKIIDNLKFTDEKKRKSQIYFNYAQILLYNFNFAKAEEICEEAIMKAEESSNYKVLIKCLGLMAKIIMNKDNLDEKVSDLISNYLEEAILLTENYNMLDLKIDVIKIKAKYHEKENNFGKVFESLDESLKLAKNLKDYQHIGGVYEEFGILYHSQGEYQEAYDHFLLALENYNYLKNPKNIAETSYNLACCASLLHLPEELISNLKIAINLEPRFKEIARNDEDFSTISNQEIFKKLVD